MERQLRTSVGLILLSSVFTTQVHAAAFQLMEQNAVNLGAAYSGTAAVTGDASSIFTNPGALMTVSGKQLALSSVAASARSKVSTESATANFGAGVQGGSGNNPGGTAFIPGLYYGQRLTDSLAIGLGTAVPFGLKTEYGNESLARYVATKSEVQTIDVMPTVAYAVSDEFSVGLSLDAMKVKATLNSNFDKSIVSGTPNTDGYGSNKADSWAYTFHTGVHYHGLDGANFGLTFHAPVKVTAKGTSISALTGESQGVTSTVNLPASVVASFSMPVTESVNILGDAQFTKWDTFDKLSLELENGTTVETQHYFKNTWRIALGAEYAYSDSLRFKLGTAYDASPVNSSYRTARIPDANRLWTSFGISYKLLNELQIHAGYAHMFFQTANIDDHGVEANGKPLFNNLHYKADYKTSADIIGLQLSWDYV